MCSGWKSRHDWNGEEWWRGVYGLAQWRHRAQDEDRFIERVKSRVWVIQKLGVSKLVQKDKPRIRHWKLNWTKAKGIFNAQRKIKEKVGTEPKKNSAECFTDFATVPWLMVFPQVHTLRHTSRSYDGFSLTHKERSSHLLSDYFYQTPK